VFGWAAFGLHRFGDNRDAIGPSPDHIRIPTRRRATPHGGHDHLRGPVRYPFLCLVGTRQPFLAASPPMPQAFNPWIT
jgi:hypothetical protein